MEFISLKENGECPGHCLKNAIRSMSLDLIDSFSTFRNLRVCDRVCLAWIDP